MKLNELVQSNNVEVYGFSAFLGLKNICKKDGNSVVLSTLPPALMKEKGITVYYSPVIPRNSRFNTTEEVVEADLNVNMVTVFDAPEGCSPQLIVTRHKGTSDILLRMYPNTKLLSGDVSPEDIADLCVVGVLPPHLIQYCRAYKPAMIMNFDYAKDGDLSGQELLDRLQIGNAICVEIKEVI